MIGTITNCACILGGSLVGSRLKHGIPENYHTILMQAPGLAAMAIGISTIARYMPQSSYPVLFIVSLALGGLIGEWAHLDERFARGVKKLIPDGGSQLAEGLQTAILLFCVGTLSILGPMESALNGDHMFLFTNSTLDLVTSMVLASSYGFGIAFAAVVLFFWQGSIYLLTMLIGGFISDALLTEISIVGGILILASGIGVLNIVKCKTMNLLPALFVPPAFIGALALVHLFF